MKKKWYFVTLLTALASLMVMQHHTVVPNQEIVLEFVNVDINSPEAQYAIAGVKRQLQTIGVNITKITKGSESGKLKITYYSDADIGFIKKILAQEQRMALNVPFDEPSNNQNQSPLQNKSKDYNFDVYQIQKGADFGTDFIVENIYEIKEGKSKTISDNFHYFFISISEKQQDISQKATQKECSIILLAIEVNAYNIPEVRAGPIS